MIRADRLSMLSVIGSLNATFVLVMMILGGPLSLSATPQSEQATSTLQTSSQGSSQPSQQGLPSEYSVLLEHLTQLYNRQDAHEFVGGSVLITLGSALAIGGGYFTYQMTQRYDCVGTPDGGGGYCTATNLAKGFVGIPLGLILTGAGLAALGLGIKVVDGHYHDEHTLYMLAQIKRDKGEKAALTYARHVLRTSSDQSRSRRISWGAGYSTFALGLYGFSYLYWETLNTSSRVSLIGGVSMSILAFYTFFTESEAERHFEEYQREGRRRRALADQPWPARLNGARARSAIQMLPLVDHDRLGLSVLGRF